MFFDSFYDFLLNADLVPRALDWLTGPPPATPSPRRTIVKALADVYNETFMDGALFAEILGGREIHLKNIIFNSTECKDGRAFRFQTIDGFHRIGNPMVWIDSQHAGAMRLADVVAASSDIPVGLEPLLFPQDFVWPKEQPDLWLDVQSHLKDSFGIETLPLMDGGVIDNEGIEGVMMAACAGDEKMPTDDPEKMQNWVEAFIPSEDALGLYIISDVPELEQDIYRPNLKASMKTHGVGGWFTVGHMIVLAWVLLLTAAGTIVQLVASAIIYWPPYGETDWTVGSFLSQCVPLVLAGALIGILLWLRACVNNILRAVSPEAPHMWKHLRLLTLYDLRYMLESRLTSTWSLTSTIFLNRIRRLMYHIIYAARKPKGAGERDTPLQDPSTHPGATDDLRSRLIPCKIYDLAHEKQNVPEWLQPSGQMIEIAARASKTPTTLWLTKEQLNVLVACGQITMLYKLLDYLRKNPAKKSQLGDSLFARGQKDWETLKRDGLAFLPTTGGSAVDGPTEKLQVRKARA